MKQASRGFSAIELLITLFIAGIFLAAGYQLFSLVLVESGDARTEASVSNHAYTLLREYGEVATNPCSELTPLANESVDIEGTASAEASVAITCPQNDAMTISKVEVVINYVASGEERSVRHATYADTSKNGLSDVTNELEGLWKFNNVNYESEIGNYGESYGPLISGAVGQNGEPNSALSFSQYYAGVPHIRVPTDSGFPKPTDGFSVTGWFNTSTIDSTERTIVSTAHNGGWGVYAGSPSCPGNLRFDVYVSGTMRSLCSTSPNTAPNSWVFFAASYGWNQLRLSVNGEGSAALSASGTMSWGPSSTPLCIAAEVTATSCDSNQLIGELDDIRYYTRPLQDTEVQQLYLRGAQ